MKKKYLCTSLMFFVSVFLFCQELVLKVKNPPTIVGWVYQKGKLENSYCLYDDNYLIFANAKEQGKPIIHIYREHSSSIISSSFCISNKQFVALDNENIVLNARFDSLDAPLTRKAHEKLIAKSIALSPNDEMEVLGFENGFIQTHYLLRRNKKNFDVYFKAHDDFIYSVSFSSLGQYFVTSGKDEKIKVWDSKTLALVKEISCYTENLCPSIFSPLDDLFVYCTSQKTLCISDIDGNLQKEIAVMDGIRLAKFTEKKDRIAVLTDSKRLEFYNLLTGKYEGAIASLENVCSFDVNIVTGDILVGTEEGEIYLTSEKDIKILKESSKQSKVKKIEVNEKDVSDKKKTYELSTNVLKYLALKEDDDIQVSDLRKPIFPIKIKDETPLEDPVRFSKKTELIEKNPTSMSAKTLNENVLDGDRIEFREKTATTEDVKEEKPSNETYESQGNVQNTTSSEKADNEIQEDENNYKED